MIKEQYVSFEVAKLLKDKGFNEEVHAWYNIFDKTNLDFSLNEAPHCNIPAPTQAMVMRWLREVHNIACQISPAKEKGFHTNKWHSYVDKLSDNWPRESLWFVETFNSYEEACEAAIKYCLENLI